MVKPINVFKKICVLGDSKVGKTSIVNKYVKDNFTEEYTPSIGTKVSKKNVPISDPSHQVQGMTVNLMIWDLLGQREHAALHKVYYAGAEGGILVCDATRLETISEIGFWVNHFRNVVPSGAPIIVAINKVDILEVDGKDKVVKAIKEVCRELTIAYMEVSARTGDNIDQLFYTVSENMVEASPF